MPTFLGHINIYMTQNSDIPTKKNIGLFGDSYVTSGALWTQFLSDKNPDWNVEVYGKGGSNLYSAIRSWEDRLREHGPEYYNIAVFTFTWARRLYSGLDWRHEQFCAFSEFRSYDQYPWDPAVIDDASQDEFNKTIPLYFKYIFDYQHNEFDHELEIKYILDLTKRFPYTKFIFLPNTELARGISKKHFHTGILLDFAFETVSNQEPDSPGVMPCTCTRPAHLNITNHRIVEQLMSNIIQNYQQYKNTVYPIDYNMFDCNADSA